jgi:hypothetical protein
MHLLVASRLEGAHHHHRRCCCCCCCCCPSCCCCCCCCPCPSCCCCSHPALDATGSPLPSPRREPSHRPAALRGRAGRGAPRPVPCAVRAVAPRAAPASAAAVALLHPRARVGRAPAPRHAHGRRSARLGRRAARAAPPCHRRRRRGGAYRAGSSSRPCNNGATLRPPHLRRLPAAMRCWCRHPHGTRRGDRPHRLLRVPAPLAAGAHAAAGARPLRGTTDAQPARRGHRQGAGAEHAFVLLHPRS